MNKHETAEAIIVMQAWIDGAEVEFSPKKEDGIAWRLHNVDENVWNWEDYEYRIKPSPREFWLNTANNTIHDPERPGGKHSRLDSRWVFVREVL